MVQSCFVPCQDGRDVKGLQSVEHTGELYLFMHDYMGDKKNALFKISAANVSAVAPGLRNPLPAIGNCACWRDCEQPGGACGSAEALCVDFCLNKNRHIASVAEYV